ncbi:MAG: hypothetical protein HKL96_12605 [Phycisphaerales bacterium]|nr:hypothetical protein [Phycisphaerales bacterium]
MPSKYIDSVPLMLSRSYISGYIWKIAPDTELVDRTMKVTGVEHVGVLPDGSVLIATAEPRPPKLPGAVQPWSLQLFNDEAETVPLAFIAEDGRYVQLESFSTSLDGEADIAAAGQPPLCKFLVAQTNSQTHVCDD